MTSESSDDEEVPASQLTTSQPSASTSASRVPQVKKQTFEDQYNALTGILDEQKLPDLVLERDELNTSQTTGAISTEEEMDAVTALLSLGEIRDDTIEGEDNAELMPIGGRNVAVDAAQEPIRLDQVSVDRAIAGLIHDDQDDQDRDITTGESKEHNAENQPSPNEPDEARPSIEKKDDNPEPTIKGTLKTKTYVLKKKAETKRCSF